MSADRGGPLLALSVAVFVVVASGCAAPAAPASPAPASPAASSSAPDESLQAAVAEADAQLTTAESQGWWSGPVCSPDLALHRENAGQEPLTDEQLRTECAANVAEFWASKDDYDRLQALGEAARTAELARVATLLGLPAGQQPTVGQVLVVHGCEQGWITDPADCAAIPAG